jgi:hypothetical protein
MFTYLHAVVQWLRHYATSRKVAGSRPDEVNSFFSIYLIFLIALDPEFTQPLTEMSIRIRKIIMFLGRRARPG